MKKYKIGYTSGAFDLFHVGHLNILQKAKEQCEYLIVGVSTDDLVESYKFKRPVIPFHDRIKIVEAIRYVDEVVPQTSMNKLETWQKLHFDVMFHGDDWKNSELYNQYEEDFAALGVELVFIPHTEGISSSVLVDKIKK